MSILVDIIPAAWRKWIYAAYAVAGLVVGTVQVALEPDPAWIAPALAVLAYLAVPLGATAASNTPAPTTTKD